MVWVGGLGSWCGGLDFKCCDIEIEVLKLTIEPPMGCDICIEVVFTQVPLERTQHFCPRWPVGQMLLASRKLEPMDGKSLREVLGCAVKHGGRPSLCLRRLGKNALKVAAMCATRLDHALLPLNPFLYQGNGFGVGHQEHWTLRAHATSVHCLFKERVMGVVTGLCPESSIKSGHYHDAVPRNERLKDPNHLDCKHGKGWRFDCCLALARPTPRLEQHFSQAQRLALERRDLVRDLA